MNVNPSVTERSGPATSLGDQAPLITVREADTMVRVRQGETIVIAGLMRERADLGENRFGILFTADPREPHRDALRISQMVRAVLRVRREAVQPDAGSEVSVRSESHANAFELLQYAIRRREGFVVDHRRHRHRQDDAVPRAARADRSQRRSPRCVLNPFLSEEDLLRRILQDFGVDVARRDQGAGGWPASASRS